METNHFNYCLKKHNENVNKLDILFKTNFI